MKPEIGLMDKNRDAVVKILNTTLADETGSGPGRS